MGASGIQAGRAFVEIVGDANPLKAAINEAISSLGSFGSRIAGFGAGIAGLGLGVVAPITAAAASFAETGDNLDELSARTGFSTTALSELSLAFKLASLDTEAFEGALRKQNKLLVDASQGTDAAVETLNVLGVSFESLQSLTPEQQFLKLGQALDGIRNPAERGALAADLFGRSGAKLLPLFQNAGEGIKSAREEAERLGLAFKPDDVANAVKLADATDTLGIVMKRTFNAIGAAVAPIFTEITNAITNTVGQINQWIQANPGAVQSALKIAAAVAIAGTAIVGVGLAFAGVALAVSFASSVFAGIAAVVGIVGTVVGGLVSAFGLLLTPVGLIAGVLGGATAAFLYFSGVGGEVVQYIGDQFAELFKFVNSVIGGVANALKRGDIAAAGEVLWAALDVTWTTGVAALNAALQPLYDGFTNIIAGIRQGWESLTNFMVKAFYDAVAAVQLAQVGLTEIFAKLMGADEQTLAEERSFQESAIGQRLAAAKAAADEESKASRERIEAARQAGLAENGDALAKARERQAAAGERLAAALKDANAEDANAPERKQFAKPGGDQEAIQRATKDAKDLFKIQGGFSSFGLYGLSGQVNPMVDEQKRTNAIAGSSLEQLKRISDGVSKLTIGA